MFRERWGSWLHAQPHRDRADNYCSLGTGLGSVGCNIVYVITYSIYYYITVI